MPPITVDGHSLSLDGRRLWLVTGTVDYARTPRALWASRLRAARQAGLNCVETSVVWSLHEPRPGVYDFTGELDLPAFIKEIAAQGMWCVLRMGPYVGQGRDLGGIPTWVLGPSQRRLRGNDPGYMGAASRFIAAACARIVDLQATGTSRKRTGPIVMVRSEHRWFCRDAAVGEAYINELLRFLRESGVTVPIATANNLYQSAEGTIEGWSGSSHLFSNMRQLGTVCPDQPRLALDVGTGRAEGARWGGSASGDAPGGLFRHLAEALAAGAQFTVSPFSAGTNFGFGAGRTGGPDGGFHATAPDAGGPTVPVAQDGQRTPSYDEVKRIATFASSFERLLSGLDPSYRPVSLAPPEGAGVETAGAKKSTRAAEGAGPASVVHLSGTQGSVVFLFAPPDRGRQRVPLVLSDGSMLSAEVGDWGVGWVIMNTHLVNRSTLDFCTLSVLALVGRVLVCFGPAGATGLLSINSASIELGVPSGSAPSIVEHEGVCVVVLSEAMADATIVVPGDAVLVGVRSIDESGRAEAHPGFKSMLRIDAKGEHAVVAESARVPVTTRAPAKVALGAWSCSPCDGHAAGKSDRFAVIEGPSALENLGAPSGYGWYRLRLKSISAKKVKGGFVEAADRLHVFADGEPVALIGEGPGASGFIEPLALKSGEQVWTVLADNLGRLADGPSMGEPKGLYGHIWDLGAIKAGASKVEHGDPVSPLKFRSPIFGVESDDRTDPRRLTWRFEHRRSTPIILVIEPLAGIGAESLGAALLLVNGSPVRLLRPWCGDRIVLSAEELSRGKNMVQVTVVGDADAALAAYKAAVMFYEGKSRITEKAEWAFARWEPPAKGSYDAWTAKGGRARGGAGIPTWWKCEFTLASASRPLHLDAAGLSKGQVFINGHNAGRYWVATARGKAVPPQTRYYLPEPWLHTDKPNELVLFDEHGAAPDKCSLVY